MIAKNRFALNRIIAPGMGLKEFYAFAASLGIHKVELRNDIRDSRILDGLPAADAARMASDLGIQIISINALQKFNLPEARKKALGELQSMLDTAAAITCPAIVLCPNNDAADTRDAAQKLADTTQALVEYGPLFTRAGILGYVEPLGFGISSLASLVAAAKAIQDSGFGCYRIVVDTFHHYIGPDAPELIQSGFDIEKIGLVHVSGVESDIAKADYRDAHRILAGAADRMHSAATIGRLQTAGYRGDVSFEPFASEIQAMAPALLAPAILASIDYLAG